MEGDLGDYEQAMDRTLAELGIERVAVTLVDLELADKAPLVEDITRRHERSGLRSKRCFGPQRRWKTTTVILAAEVRRLRERVAELEGK